MKERELLQRVITAWEDDRYELIDAMVDVVVDIKDYLANPPEPVNVYPFCGVVKMPDGWNTFANQETDTSEERLREECAAICERVAALEDDGFDETEYQEGAFDCAEAIRAGGKK